MFHDFFFDFFFLHEHSRVFVDSFCVPVENIVIMIFGFCLFAVVVAGGGGGGGGCGGGSSVVVHLYLYVLMVFRHCF